MTCADVERALLDGALSGRALDASLSAHVSRCASCARMAATQRRLDAMFSATLAPSLSASFRRDVNARLTPPLTVPTDALPDVLHLASCAIVTGICLLVVPLPASVILSVGTLASAMTYLLFAVLRDTLDENPL
jgi:anti-sigma factor RsiW